MANKYHEPSGDEIAGHLTWKAPLSAYEVFMKEQNIPIYRGIGAYDVRQLPLAPWKRMGGQGTFIELDGQGGKWGFYLVEVPARGVLNPERHMYEEIFMVLEGRGSTEVWREGHTKKRIFEWQPGAHFAVPLNAWHRLVNAASSPALVLVATSAPPVMQLFQNRNFVFNNPFEFLDRYDESENYFKPQDEFEADLLNGRAVIRSSLLPDIVNCYVPLDNQRGPGFRMFQPVMANNTFFIGFIAQYPSGRYSKAHYHESGPVLVCLKGKGYSITWPIDLGPRPWEAGKGHLVKRQDYAAGGIVSAAPGGGNWFHQHFCISEEPFRVRAIIGNIHDKYRGGERSGEDVVGMNEDLSKGGHTIGYREEDPHIRKEYQEYLAKENVEFTMPESLFL